MAHEKECSNQKYVDPNKTTLATGGGDYTMQECFQAAADSDVCAENVVEWGRTAHWDPDSKGWCMCYPEGPLV